MMTKKYGTCLYEIKVKGFIFSLFLFPIMLLSGFLLHPCLLEMKTLSTAQDLADRFHNNPCYHIGHFIVMLSVPLIIIVMFGILNMLKNSGYRWGFWGGIAGICGAFILAVDKGALCLVLSAFDTLPEQTFQNFIPYLQVIVNKDVL